MTVALTTTKLLDLLFEHLGEGWNPSIDELMSQLSVEELVCIDELYKNIQLTNELGRSNEEIFFNTADGKLAEYAIAHRLRAAGFIVVQNFENQTPKEPWWDLRLVIDGIGYNLEVKTQDKKTDSIRFVQHGKDAPAFLMHWNRVHALIVLIPTDKRFKLLGILNPSTVSSYCPYTQNLNSRRGIQIMLDKLDTTVARIL